MMTKNDLNIQQVVNQKISLIGASSGWGAQLRGTESGPEKLKSFGIIEKLQEAGINIQWNTFVTPPQNSTQLQIESPAEALEFVIEENRRLAQIVRNTISQGDFPFVIGGDHAIAVGTWTGVTTALHCEEKFGLIWIDAHMDAHVPETSPSMAYHGMPVAALLGYGQHDFVNGVSYGAKIKPEHLVLIGVHSFEKEEEQFLKESGVKIFYMDQVRQAGFERVFEEALKIVKKDTTAFGVSIDLDAFDPSEAPGVGTPEVGGLFLKDVLPAFHKLIDDKKLAALEIVEYNPSLDINDKTCVLVEDLLFKILSGRD